MSEIYEPLGDRVLVKPDAKEAKTSGGILVPETAQAKPQRGEVIAIGPTVKTIKEGDRVMYGKNSGTQIDQELLMFNESTIYAIIK